MSEQSERIIITVPSPRSGDVVNGVPKVRR
jgi:hypothetical protein